MFVKVKLLFSHDKPKGSFHINPDNIVLVENDGWTVHMTDGKKLVLDYDSRMRLARALGIEVQDDGK